MMDKSRNQVYSSQEERYPEKVQVNIPRALKSSIGDSIRDNSVALSKSIELMNVKNNSTVLFKENLQNSIDSSKSPLENVALIRRAQTQNKFKRAKPLNVKDLSKITQKLYEGRSSIQKVTNHSDADTHFKSNNYLSKLSQKLPNSDYMNTINISDYKMRIRVPKENTVSMQHRARELQDELDSIELKILNLNDRYRKIVISINYAECFASIMYYITFTIIDSTRTLISVVK